MKRTGILGGAFNPPHLGHMKLAELALRHLELDEVRFIPTARSPHKAEPEDAPGSEARLVLLREALEGTSLPFVVDPIELERGGMSYTVDTLESLREREPDSAWILLLGSDQLPGLPAWYRCGRVLELASLAVAPRPGAPRELPMGFEIHLSSHWSGLPGDLVWLPGTELPVSSSELRARIRQGDPVGGPIEGLSAQVQAAIWRENYYR